jgi:hypothetical protein
MLAVTKEGSADQPRLVLVLVLVLLILRWGISFSNARAER